MKRPLAILAAAAVASASVSVVFVAGRGRGVRAFSPPRPLCLSRPQQQLGRSGEWRVRSVSSTQLPEAEVAEATDLLGGSGGGGPQRVSKEVEFAIEGDTLETLPQHIAIGGGFLLVNVAVMLRALASVSTTGGWLSCALAVPLAILVADALTGIYHWSVDNYPLGVASIAFQGHHKSPWTITYRGFFNNIHKPAKGLLPLLGMLILAQPHIPAALGLGASISVLCFVMSQELHKYSHMVRAPAWIAALQDAGVILSKREHGQHHSSPFEEKYCIVTGWCNGPMDQAGVFRWLERVVFSLTKVEPNCWTLDTTDTVRSAALGTSSR
jgi:hypothetical protein